MHPLSPRRRRITAWVSAAALTLVAPIAAALLPLQAQAQERITLVAPFPPGGPVDLLSRLLADGLQRRSGQTVLVENLPGAAGNLGMDKVRKAKPDGKTLLVVPAGNLTINPTLMPAFPFQIERDFTLITLLAKAPNVLVASPASQLRSVNDLLSQAQTRPGTLAYASPGVGSGLHLAGELFKAQTHTDLLHVPYTGTGPALTDVMGGVVPLSFANLPSALPHIRTGKLVALGLTDSARSPIAPDIPTLAETGVQGVVVTSWYGLLAPANTPPAVVEAVYRDVQEILMQATAKEQLLALGLTPVALKPSEFAQHLRQETSTWAKVIRERRISADQ